MPCGTRSRANRRLCQDSCFWTCQTTDRSRYRAHHGLFADFALLDDADGRSFASEEPSRAQADDAAADDQDLWGLCHAAVIADAEEIDTGWNAPR